MDGSKAALIQRDDEDESEAPEPPAPVEVESFAEGRSDDPGEEIDETLREQWIDQLEFFLQRADADFAAGMLGITDDSDTEFEFWNELHEKPGKRAYYLRAALILRDGEFGDQEALDELISTSFEDAEDEAATLKKDASFADQYPEAFPSTWSERVKTHLNPPADLDSAKAAASLKDVSTSLNEAATILGPDIFEKGLPVQFAEALDLKQFPFKLSFDKQSDHKAIQEFGVQAKEWMKAKVTANLANNWMAGKQSLVSDIAQGRKVIQTETWHLVSEPRNYQPDLDSLAAQAMSSDIDVWAMMSSDVVPGWEYELALAKTAKFLQPLHSLTALLDVSEAFGNALASADQLVVETQPEDRIDVANRWAERWGYGGAAFDAVKKAIEDNADEMAVDMAKDVLISAIPVVGWIWGAKEIVETAVELYDAGMSIYDTRTQAETARTVVALQRAAAKMALAEHQGAATLVMTVASEGIGRVAGKVGGDGGSASPAPGGSQGGTPGGPPSGPNPDPWAGSPDIPSGTQTPATTPDPWAVPSDVGGMVPVGSGGPTPQGPGGTAPPGPSGPSGGGPEPAPGHRGATAQGTGESFEYEYHPPTPAPTVEYKRPSKPPEGGATTPEGKAGSTTTEGAGGTVAPGKKTPYENRNPDATPDEIRVGALLNDLLPEKVWGAPETPGKGRSGDYRMEGPTGPEPIDLYQPETGTAGAIFQRIVKDKKRQANIIAIELGRGKSGQLGLEDAQKLIKYFETTEGHTLERIIVIKDGKIILDSPAKYRGPA